MTALRRIAAPVLGGVLLLCAPAALSAQSPSRINIYRYVLGVDVPESPALIALDQTPSRVLRGSAPKPIAATASGVFDGDGVATAVAVDVVPYYLVGGGTRDLKGYRSNSVAGRLSRVGTKTQLGIGSEWPADGGGAVVSLGLRATFHDPHDPVLNSPLPEAVDSALRAAGAPLPADDEETVTDRGASLRPVFDRAARAMRARGGIQISGGYAVAARADGGLLEGDSLGPARHVVWLSGQITRGPRLDLLLMAQVRMAADQAGSSRFGAGLERKGHDADFRAELYYDTHADQVQGGVSTEVRALPRASLVASVLTVHDTSASVDARRLRAYLSLRWFMAEDH
jgi:hypothetical protein